MQIQGINTAYSSNVNNYKNQNSKIAFNASFVKANASRFNNEYYDYITLIIKLIGQRYTNLIKSKEHLKGVLRPEQITQYAKLLEIRGVTHPDKPINTGDIIYKLSEVKEMEELKKAYLKAQKTGSEIEIRKAQDNYFNRAYEIAQKEAKPISPKTIQAASKMLDEVEANPNKHKNFLELSALIYQKLAA